MRRVSMNRRGCLAGAGSAAIAAVLPPVRLGDIAGRANLSPMVRPIPAMTGLIRNPAIRVVVIGDSIMWPLGGAMADAARMRRLLDISMGNL